MKAIEDQPTPWWISPAERISAVRRAVSTYLAPTSLIGAAILFAAFGLIAALEMAYPSYVRISHLAGGTVLTLIGCFVWRRPLGENQALAAQGFVSTVFVALQLLLLEFVPRPSEIVPQCLLVLSLGLLVVSRRWVVGLLLVLHLHAASVIWRHFDEADWSFSILVTIGVLGMALSLNLARDSYLWRARHLRMEAEERRVAAEESLVALRHETAERQRLQDQLVMAEKSESMGRLAGGIAHDFNNLLVPILANADLLMLSDLEDIDLEMATEIRDASERASLLVRQLLSYAGRAPNAPTDVDLVVETNTLVKLARSSFPSRVKISCHSDLALATTFADRAQLQQVILNLILNAAESVGAEGQVQVSIEHMELLQPEAMRLVPKVERPGGAYLRIAVSDDGPGIDEQVQARMFDPFFTTKEDGKGLELSSTPSFAEQHRGGLKVDSTAGEGTTISLFLPPAEPSQSTIEEASLTAAVDRGDILIVDDDEHVRKVTERCLTTAGYHVLEAASGTDAVRIVKNRKLNLDAVVLDMRMPGMTGEEAFDRMREESQQLPVLVCSGYDEGTALERLRQQPGVSFVAKPYTNETLLDSLRSLLRGFRPGSQRSVRS